MDLFHSWIDSRILLFAIVVVAGAWLYDQVTKRIPSRLPNNQAPNPKFGFVLADGFGSDARANGVDVVFVHGLGSNPDTTWLAPKLEATSKTADDRKRVCWITDFLPEDISPTVRQGVRVFFYNHDSYWQKDAVQTRLPNLANELLQRANTEIRRTDEERRRGLVFVGHSYGGLLIKQALKQACKSPEFGHMAEQTKAVFFLGTPHRGSSISLWGTMFAKTLQFRESNPSIVQQLAYDSIALLDLHREFMTVIGNTVQVVNFFEQRRSLILNTWIGPWKDFCVREQSATFEGTEVKNVGLPVDHFGLNKFDSRTTSYASILSQLLETLTPATLQRYQPIYSVPLDTVPSYAERRNLSSDIESKFEIHHKNNSVLHALVIHGLGGTGKTQLALNFIKDHKDVYNPILWIDATDRETILSSFTRCAVELQLSIDQTSSPASPLADSPTIIAVLRWLRDRKQSDDEWLVVIDNVDDLSSGVREVLPKGARGNVLITSQDSYSHMLFGKGCEKIHVGVMEPLEARSLLLQHIGPNRGSEHIQLCDSIVERLGCFALAVDLAGSYISNASNPKAALKQYLADYDKHQDDLLKSEDFRGLSAYEKTVWTVWDTTLNTIERRYSDVQPNLLLGLLAHAPQEIFHDEVFRLASHDLPDARLILPEIVQLLPSWLERYMQLDNQKWDDFDYRKALEPLIRYSLVQRVDGEWPGVTMHGLVRWRSRRSQENQPWKSWYLVLVYLACFQTDYEDGTPQFRRHMATYIPGICNASAGDKTLSVQANLSIWYIFGRVYSKEGRWTEAEEFQLKAMETSKRTLGQEHPETLTRIATLATTYSEQGRRKEEEDLRLEELEISKRTLGHEHPHTLSSIASLAVLYLDQGQWQEAEGLLLQVIERRMRVLGQEHLDTLSSIANLAVTYSNLGRWEVAEELEIYVLETRRRLLGQKHPDTLKSIANLASTYSNQERWKEAEELEVQALDTMKRVLGPEHLDTLGSIANLAATYSNQGRWKEAEELDVQVLDTMKRVLGQGHPDTLGSMGNLAVTYQNQRRFQEAEELEVQVIETRKRVLGLEHPDTLLSMANLSWNWTSQGHYDKALRLMSEVVEMEKRVLGLDHQRTQANIQTLDEWQEHSRVRLLST